MPACYGLVAELADVGGIGGDGHGFEVHGAHAVIGAEDRAQEAAAEVKTGQLRLERELDRLRGEVADDDQYRGDRRDGLWLANPDEDVLVVVVEGDGLAVGDGGVAVVEFAEPTIPVEERGRVGVLEGDVGGCVRCGWWGRGFAFGGWGWGVPGDERCGGVGG